VRLASHRKKLNEKPEGQLERYSYTRVLKQALIFWSFGSLESKNQ
jgi:hypothetical protein